MTSGGIWGNLSSAGPRRTRRRWGGPEKESPNKQEKQSKAERRCDEVMVQIKKWGRILAADEREAERKELRLEICFKIKADLQAHLLLVLCPSERNAFFRNTVFKIIILLLFFAPFWFNTTIECCPNALSIEKKKKTQCKSRVKIIANFKWQKVFYTTQNKWLFYLFFFYVVSFNTSAKKIQTSKNGKTI